jgi:DNA-binding response OmpR family regulator
MKTSKILVVDGEPDLLYGYEHILRSAGYDVLQAATGAEALKIAGEEKPDLMLLDVTLPDMSGIEVCRQIKADAELAHTFVINISGLRVSAE